MVVQEGVYPSGRGVMYGGEGRRVCGHPRRDGLIVRLGKDVLDLPREDDAPEGSVTGKHRRVAESVRFDPGVHK